MKPNICRILKYKLLINALGEEMYAFLRNNINFFQGEKEFSATYILPKIEKLYRSETLKNKINTNTI